MSIGLFRITLVSQSDILKGSAPLLNLERRFAEKRLVGEEESLSIPRLPTASGSFCGINTLSRSSSVASLLSSSSDGKRRSSKLEVMSVKVDSAVAETRGEGRKVTSVTIKRE